MLTAVVVTGLVVYGWEQQAGPLAGLVTEQTAEAVEEWHEVLANMTLALVFVHIAAVVLASFATRRTWFAPWRPVTRNRLRSATRN